MSISSYCAVLEIVMQMVETTGEDKEDQQDAKEKEILKDEVELKCHLYLP
jgi:hypothetical protein